MMKMNMTDVQGEQEMMSAYTISMRDATPEDLTLLAQ